jgi:hypothetical protein
MHIRQKVARPGPVTPSQVCRVDVTEGTVGLSYGKGLGGFVDVNHAAEPMHWQATHPSIEPMHRQAGRTPGPDHGTGTPEGLPAWRSLFERPDRVATALRQLDER